MRVFDVNLNYPSATFGMTFLEFVLEDINDHKSNFVAMKDIVLDEGQ